MEIKVRLISVQLSSVTQSCPTLCDPMDCSTPGLPVHHQFPEFTQTHVHRVGDAIQPSHPLSSPSPAFNLSQHQGLFRWVSSSHQVAKVLEFQLQHQSFLSVNTQDWSPLGWTGWISLLGDWTELKLNINNHVKELLMNLMHFWQKKINIWLFAVFPLPPSAKEISFLVKSALELF